MLAAKAADRPLPIASTTKLMTAYLALKKLKPNQTLTAAPYRPIASTEILLGLRAGEKITVRDLLYGLLLPSANDAAQTLAVGGGRLGARLRRRDEPGGAGRSGSPTPATPTRSGSTLPTTTRAPATSPPSPTCS